MPVEVSRQLKNYFPSLLTSKTHKKFWSEQWEKHGAIAETLWEPTSPHAHYFRTVIRLTKNLILGFNQVGALWAGKSLKARAFKSHLEQHTANHKIVLQAAAKKPGGAHKHLFQVLVQYDLNLQICNSSCNCHSRSHFRNIKAHNKLYIP